MMPSPAPPADGPSREDVERAEAMAVEKYGFVPNQIKILAEHSPAAARTYMAGMTAAEQGRLSDAEREVVILAVSRYNDCHYCTRTHAFLGVNAGLSKETVEAIHRGRLPEEPRARALVRATRLLMDRRGLLTQEEIDDLRAHDVDRTELYEINALIGIKIFSNYVNHVAQTPVDEIVTEDERIQSMWDVIGTMDHDDDAERR
jgi:uncharacterized peroxidase-related enzyme